MASLLVSQDASFQETKEIPTGHSIHSLDLTPGHKASVQTGRTNHISPPGAAKS